MTVFEGGDAIKEFLEDIDLGLGVVSEFEHVYQTLTSRGFAVVDEPTEVFEDVGKTVELHHDARGLQIDLFERQVVGKLWITDRMYDRATEFWVGSHATAVVLADGDMFLLKAVSGGDLASGRRRDIEDMRTYAQRGLDYGVILTEADSRARRRRGSTPVTRQASRITLPRRANGPCIGGPIHVLVRAVVGK